MARSRKRKIKRNKNNGAATKIAIGTANMTQAAQDTAAALARAEAAEEKAAAKILAYSRSMKKVFESIWGLDTDLSSDPDNAKAKSHGHTRDLSLAYTTSVRNILELLNQNIVSDETPGKSPAEDASTPATDIEAMIAAAKTNYDALQAEFKAALERGADARIETDKAIADLKETKGELQTSKDEIARLKLALGETQAQLTAETARADAAEERVARLEENAETMACEIAAHGSNESTAGAPTAAASAAEDEIDDTPDNPERYGLSEDCVKQLKEHKKMLDARWFNHRIYYAPFVGKGISSKVKSAAIYKLIKGLDLSQEEASALLDGRTTDILSKNDFDFNQILLIAMGEAAEPEAHAEAAPLRSGSASAS